MVKKTKEAAEETFNALLDSAAALFLKQGVASTTLQQIAENAGVTRGALYWHFDNKDAVILALLDRNWIEYERAHFARLEQILASADPQALIDECCEQLSLLVSEPGIHQSLAVVLNSVEFTEEGSDLQNNLHQRIQARYEALQKIFDRLDATGKLADGVDKDTAFAGLWSIQIGLFYTYIDPGMKPVNLGVHGPKALRLMLNGLFKRD